jgi:hypothetical protein
VDPTKGLSPSRSWLHPPNWHRDAVVSTQTNRTRPLRMWLSGRAQPSHAAGVYTVEVRQKLQERGGVEGMCAVALELPPALEGRVDAGAGDTRHVPGGADGRQPGDSLAARHRLPRLLSA